MKFKLAILILIILPCVFAGSEVKAQTPFPVYKPIPLLSNGNYEAVVKYYNSSTYQRATYTLDVKVDQDAVVAIYFGDGGSIHAGLNNQGYVFTGGRLGFETSQGKIVGATTRVTVTDNNGSRTFDITL